MNQHAWLQEGHTARTVRESDRQPAESLHELRLSERCGLIVAVGIGLVTLILLYTTTSATAVGLPSVAPLVIGTGFALGGAIIACYRASVPRGSRLRWNRWDLDSRRILRAVSAGRIGTLTEEDAVRAPRLAAEAALLSRAGISSSLLITAGLAITWVIPGLLEGIWRTSAWMVGAAFAVNLAWSTTAFLRYRRLYGYARRSGALD